MRECSVEVFFGGEEGGSKVVDVQMQGIFYLQRDDTSLLYHPQWGTVFGLGR
jgi:hypothetical protein